MKIECDVKVEGDLTEFCGTEMMVKEYKTMILLKQSNIMKKLEMDFKEEIRSRIYLTPSTKYSNMRQPIDKESSKL